MPQPPKRHFEPLSYKGVGACIDVQRQQFEREVEIPIVYDGIEVTWRRVDFR